MDQLKIHLHKVLLLLFQRFLYHRMKCLVWNLKDVWKQPQYHLCLSTELKYALKSSRRISEKKRSFNGFISIMIVYMATFIKTVEFSFFLKTASWRIALRASALTIYLSFAFFTNVFYYGNFRILSLQKFAPARYLNLCHSQTFLLLKLLKLLKLQAVGLHVTNCFP